MALLQKSGKQSTSAKNKNGLKPKVLSHFYGADDRGRTGTGIASHGILSPGRLPVPPHRQMLFTTYGIIS